jgi:hypothetical protein
MQNTLCVQSAVGKASDQPLLADTSCVTYALAMRGPKTPGARLRDAREHAGLQLDDLAYLVRQRLPRERFSRETLRLMETGKKPTALWRLPVVAVLCDQLRISPYDLDAGVADDLEKKMLVQGGAAAIPHIPTILRGLYEAADGDVLQVIRMIEGTNQ